MPGTTHELFLQLLTRSVPGVLEALLQQPGPLHKEDSALHTYPVYLPDALYAKITEPPLASVGPQADAARAPAGAPPEAAQEAEGEPAPAPVYERVFGIELQTSWDADKIMTWQIYLSVMQHRYRCWVHLYVIAPELSIADRIRRSLPKSKLKIEPLVTVISRDSVPRITEPKEARANPIQTMLSTLFHAKLPDSEELDADVIDAFFSTLEDEAWKQRCYPLVENLIGKKEAANIMSSSAVGEQVLWPGFRATMQKMRREGREEGREEGRRAMQAAVIKLMAARGLELSGGQRRRLEDAPIAALQRYLDRALSADTTDQVFGDAP